MGDPAVTADSNGKLHVFANGIDHALWTIAENSPGGAYGGWVSLGGYILHSPAAVTNTNGSVEVFAIGSDNAVWHNWTVDASFNWNGWASLGGSIAGSPSAIILAGVVHVAGTGTDDALWVLEHDPGRDWFPIVSLGGSLTSDPAFTVGANTTYWVFVRGTDNGIWSRSGFGSSFFNWATEGGAAANGPSAVVNPGNGLVSVFIEGPDTTLEVAEQTQLGPVWQ